MHEKNVQQIHLGTMQFAPLGHALQSAVKKQTFLALDAAAAPGCESC